jgi:hypothetical protein
MKNFIYFLIISAVSFTITIYSCGNEYLNFFSICSQLFSICVIGAFYDTKTPKLYNKNLSLNSINPYLIVKHINLKNINIYVILILVFTIVFGLVNTYVIVNRLEIDQNTNNFLKIISYTSLGITQFGGWFFQSVLIYTLSNIIGSKLLFNTYLKIVGIAYIGFLLLSVFTLLYNLISLPQNISIENFNELVKNSLVYSISGKVSEFFVLSIIACGISANEHFKPTTSLFICFLPSCLLLTFKYIFELIL